VHVALDGAYAGAIAIGAALRPDAEAMVRELRATDVEHVALVSGDRRAVAEAIGTAVGVDRVYAEQSPQDKLDVVRAAGASAQFAPLALLATASTTRPRWR